MFHHLYSWNLRKVNCGKNKDPDYKGLVPIQRVRRVVYDDKSAQIVRNQFPLIVAESITIHKSQGSTYKNDAVDLTRCDRQLTYVALSRATTLNGLYII
jgi:ATP-dependent exoDNAse (exonuclease V) alpha subunit